MITKTSAIISSPHHVTLKNLKITTFLSQVLVTDWIAARSSTPPICFVNPTRHLPPALLPKTPNQHKFTLKMATAIFCRNGG
jgi:hypothetical protein